MDRWLGLCNLASCKRKDFLAAITKETPGDNERPVLSLLTAASMMQDARLGVRNLAGSVLDIVTSHAGNVPYDGLCAIREEWTSRSMVTTGQHYAGGSTLQQWTKFRGPR